MKKPSAARSAGKLPPSPPLPLAQLRGIVCGPEICGDIEAGSAREWIITNGLGGYASSTVLGMNTRRYHGLLVAASRPPVHRAVLLSKVEETLVTPSGRRELSSNRCGGIVHPEGHRCLVEFRLDPWPTFFYRVGEILLEKTVFMLPGENATVIGYTLHASSSPVELIVRPLAALRNFQDLSEENDTLHPEIVEQGPEVLVLRPYEDFPPLMIHHNAELVEPSACWYNNFEYLREEKEAPLPDGAHVREDLWSPGFLRYLLRVGESCTLVASTGRRGRGDFVFHRRRIENTQAMIAHQTVPPGSGPLAARLAWTADSFFAHRSLHDPAEGYVLAGFPWLSSWGRDALVALPGLALCTHRWDLARSVLETLASHVKGGLVPVRFSEEEGTPEYDSADTSLWFVWAIWHYLRITRDTRFISKKMLDPLQDILEGYLRGTQFGIGMDEDGLIRLREAEMPLTWMDAREPGGDPETPGRAVTPRTGKAVEVNALWYCALMIMGTIAERLDLKRAKAYSRLARLVQQNFLRTFLSPRGFLYDRVTSAGPDPSVRPNMLIAASLPFSPLSKAQADRVLGVVERHLLTPMGIRTLSPDHPMYRGRYEGDLATRAHAYHQGTVWTWLIGPYVSAVCRVRGLTRSTQAALGSQLKPYLAHLQEGALGSVSELFDGDAPHAPRGAPSSAWAVGELLRAIREAKLAGL
ncbi:MAG: glycogen debranching enzyme family protein [Candidatus Omnitrophica bacterium]|nr:glycogen debranching enzyme family protein [Candidatus Omnitrophota bacterium]